MRRANAGHDVHVYERDAEGATYGWGLVFSDVALAFVREVAEAAYRAFPDKPVVAMADAGPCEKVGGKQFRRSLYVVTDETNGELWKIVPAK